MDYNMFKASQKNQLRDFTYHGIVDGTFWMMT